MIRPMLLVLAATCADVLGTSGPAGVITSPEQWSVINSNGMRIHCAVPNSSKKVGRVEFRASYADAAVRRRENVLIGVDSAAPYEIVWNCRDVPDQAWTDLRLRCRIVDNDGGVYTTPSHFVILDRNSEHHDQSLASVKLRHTEQVRIDGSRDDAEPWTRTAPLSLANDDNACRIYSLFDDGHLYMLLLIEDDVVMNRYDTAAETIAFGDTLETRYPTAIPRIWLDDCISLGFDTKNDKNEALDFDDKMLYVVPGGGFHSISLACRKQQVTAWAEGVRVRSQRIHEASDSRRMSIEMAIPWRDLGVVPDEGAVIGFQVYVTDRDLPDGERVISSWTGQPHNHCNPSEWGRLVLTAKTHRAGLGRRILIAAAVALAFAAALTAWCLRRRMSPASRGAEAQTPQPPAGQLDAADVICRQARAFIDAHLTDPSLHRHTIARHLNLSAPYLSSVFNRKAGESLPAHINRKRLEKARTLLRDPRNSVSRVALEVGYNSPDHFIRTFKAAHGMTPREFQRRNAVGTW